MHRVCVVGAGTIGKFIAILLANEKDYEVYLIDNDVKHLQVPNKSNLLTARVDVINSKELEKFFTNNQFQAVISSLPYFLSIHIAKVAVKVGLNYFDLTEDIEVTQQVKQLAKGQDFAFVSQCGVAPGFINIVANDLMQRFDKLYEANLRAGSLPQHSHNALQYAITWSLDGVINEYGNICYGLIKGKKNPLQALDDIETVELDGTVYEAFNTSGGVGSLVETYQHKIDVLNYKTLRYPGHGEKMRFLMVDLHLNDDRATLKRILEKSLPKTDQDVMLVYVSVSGEKKGEFIEENYFKKLYPKYLFDQNWSAIQLSTASSVCTVVDIVLHNEGKYQGFILQEQFSLEKFLSNRFGQIFQLF